MEASGYESLVGLFRKLVVPFGDGGLFFSYWAELLSNAEAAKLLCPEWDGNFDVYES